MSAPPDGWSTARWDRVCAYGDAMYRRDYQPLFDSQAPGATREQKGRARALLHDLRMETRRLAAAVRRGFPLTFVQPGELLKRTADGEVA